MSDTNATSFGILAEGRTEFYHELNCPAGRYRFELWTKGWRMLRKMPDGLIDILDDEMTDDEMMNAIKLLKG